MGESNLKRRNVSRLLVIQNGGVIVQNGMDDDKKKGRGGGVAGRRRGSSIGINAARVTSTDDGERSSTEPQTNNFPGYNKEQWTKLMELLKTNKSDERLFGKKIFNNWIVDSGPSHHMTGNIEMFTDVHKISPSPVGLPNGKNTYAVKEGSLFLGGTSYLHHVLFVPNMNCTLISVAKLLHDLNCTVTFDYDLCVIQEQTSRTLIGAGEQCGVSFDMWLLQW